jgi:IS30 family transposase
VRHRLTQEWSPEQISGHQREQFPSDPHRHISHQTIYEWLANHCEYRAHFESFLRHGRYGKRKTGPKPVGVIRNRVSISERPSIVSDKGRLGDWEGDTVVGSGHHGSIATMVERLSGYLCAGLMPNGRSASLNRATHRIMSKLPSDLLRTLTVDNGVEFAKHEALARKLSIEIYFADPYCSNQRALNENTNGLLRQYFPKGSNFLELSHVALARAVTRLNNRPRKRLGYQNPLEFLVRAGFALQN